MAMRTASPWWASLAFGVGLLVLLVGERIFGYQPTARVTLDVIALVGILGVTGLRTYTTMVTSGARRNVERALLFCQLGVLLGLVLYLFTTKWGLSHLHLSEKGADKVETVLTVLWTILLVCSLVPMFMIEMSLGTALRTSVEIKGGSDEGIEYMRVRDVGWSGLSVAFAMAFLMVTCNVAEDRNIQRDVSYFKTSSPGDSTKGIVASSQDAVKILLFFPEPNEVKDQVKSYFEALASATGKVQIEEHDRLIDAELAGKYKVTKDGTIVLVRGTGDKEKSGTIDVDTDLAKARNGSKLRNFDREVNGQLRKLLAEKRKAYLTSGHGEITDPESMPPDLKGKLPERRTTAFKKRLADLDYEVKDLGLVDLVKDVPQDATVVIVLAPTVPLQPAEWASLERYLDRGGRLLIAMDPTAEPSMSGLESKFGLKFNPGHLTDDQAFLPQRGNASDRRFVITTQFSAHASTTALSRAARSGLVLIDSGALEEVPFTTKGAENPKKTITIHSMETSWLDLDNNFAFDSSTEKRQKWNIAAAIEGPKVKGADGKDKDGWRALVFADVDIFGDALVQSMGHAAIAMVSDIGGGLLDNSMDWLVGKENWVGDVVSEDDKPIEHTKSKDAKWFLLTIVGAPLLVLTLGLVGTLTRRRRNKQPAKSVEVKP
jgi:hypothetical protein